MKKIILSFLVFIATVSASQEVSHQLLSDFCEYLNMYHMEGGHFFDIVHRQQYDFGPLSYNERVERDLKEIQYIVEHEKVEPKFVARIIRRAMNVLYKEEKNVINNNVEKFIR